MRMSEQIGELAKALAKAQSEIKGAIKDSTNPFFGKGYADLESVWEAAKPLSKNGLSVVQTTKDTEKGVCVITTLLHESGQWIQGEMTLTPTKQDAQGIGSTITYARRYSLAAISGIAQIDDDAEGAVGRDDTRPPEVKKVISVPAKTSPAADCDHIWKQSKYKEHEEYCTKGCKSTRPRKVG